jgi:hypothetical protein
VVRQSRAMAPEQPSTHTCMVVWPCYLVSKWVAPSQSGS